MAQLSFKDFSHEQAWKEARFWITAAYIGFSDEGPTTDLQQVLEDLDLAKGLVLELILREEDAHAYSASER